MLTLHQFSPVALLRLPLNGLATRGGIAVFPTGMKLPVLISILSTTLLMSCENSKKKPVNPPTRNPVQAPATPAKEETGDVAFQSFISRLRTAVSTHDLPTLASMMPSDFGHRWDAAPEGESPFDYWDKNNLWGELGIVLNSKWTPHDGFMVAPPKMIEDPNYPGYRAGVAMQDGSWKFAYFVPPPPPE